MDDIGVNSDQLIAFTGRLTQGGTMPFLIGFLLALAVAAIARLVRLDGDRAFHPMILVMVASYYVLFAVMGGAPSQLIVEFAIMGSFFALIAVGLRTNAWWFVIGIGGHGVLDLFHGSLVVNPGVPAWWPAFCLSFDITFAAIMAWLLLRAEIGRLPRLAPRRVNHTTGVTTAVGFALLVGATGLQAQASAPSRRGSIGLSVVQTRPVGELGRNIGAGYGVMATYFHSLESTGLLSLRFDIGVAEYDNESRRAPFGGPIGDRVEVRVRTAHAILPAALGLQLTLPAGSLMPYVHAGVGGHAFYTESQIQPTSGGGSIASTINQSDGAAAWIAGGGLYVAIKVKSMRVLLDLGAQYTRGGRQQYLAQGSMVDSPEGGVEITPMESETRMVVLRVGARIGL